MKMDGTILVVEPNGGLLTTLDILLKKHFCKVISVDSLEQMHSALQGGAIDVLVFDLGLCTDSKNPGCEVEQLGGQYPNLQIVLLATFAQIGTAVSLSNSCAMDYITKPWNNGKVAITVGNALLVGKMKRENAQLNQQVERLNHELELARSRAAQVQRDQLACDGPHQERVSILSVLEDETLEQMELRIIKAVLLRNRGNISLTAQQLGITRQTMYNKGKKYGLID